jgi:hypothetical protein
MKKTNLAVLCKKMLILLTLLCCTSQTFATEYGADLLNGTGDFETEADRAVWELWNSVAGTSTWSTTMPYSGSWSWHGGPSVASANQMRVMTNPLISTIGNREHRLMVKVRSQVSTPSWVKYSLGSSGWIALTSYSSNWGLNTQYYTTTSTENAIKLTFNMYANSANDNIYIDAVELARERVMPTVYSDSVGSTLVVGSETKVSFVAPPYTVYDPRNAFDPDITILSANANITDVQWISDNEVSAKITANSTGQLQLVFRNEYCDMEFTYVMFAVNAPSACGSAGTEFSSSDLNRDCIVNLSDFAIFASEWLTCTNPEVEECDSGL